MLWAVLALASSFTWASVFIFDKILRTKYLKDSLALAAAFGIFAALCMPFLVPIVGFPDLPLKFALIAFAAGVAIPLAVIVYLKAMSFEEASRVTPLMSLQLLFILLLAAAFIGEKLTPSSYLAFFLLIFGGFLVSVKHFRGMFRLSEALPLMALSGIIVASVSVLLKFAYSSQPFWKVFFVYYVGNVVGQLLLFLIPRVRKSFSQAVSSNKMAFLSLLFIDGLFTFSARFLYNAAIPLAPITLLSVLGSFQSVFVLAIATFISIKFPMFLKEAIDPKTIGLKVVAIALMAAGLYLLYF